MSEDVVMAAMGPVAVEVKNFPGRKPPCSVAKGQTYALGAVTYLQVCGYEPTRLGVRFIAIDSAFLVVFDSPPTVYPDTSSATTPSDGLYVPTGLPGIYVPGHQAMWIVSLGTNTRVSVVREYE